LKLFRPAFPFPFPTILSATDGHDPRCRREQNNKPKHNNDLEVVLEEKTDTEVI
jgi:hypothetical protein